MAVPSPSRRPEPRSGAHRRPSRESTATGLPALVRSTRPAQRPRPRAFEPLVQPPDVEPSDVEPPAHTPVAPPPMPPLDREVERLVRVIRAGTHCALCACVVALVLATLAVTL